MIDDDIKVKNGKYVCTIYFHRSMILVPVSALENFLFLKSYIEFIEYDMWWDYENSCYSLKLAGKSLTNILRTRFEIINYFIKTS